ncbi:unnamed protein product [Zymoseptoria tritici ST99CH_3D7]|uniref:Uncharacterized protein n=1 Tax=Zymoseptoria tritici (strain ST99CH_3D7) TaxID=1276538 RepID=A0A1X7S788_ZYMT9|nr:unnamed protein product [Zymoseptoria tritici ST99CH_3D7]
MPSAKQTAPMDVNARPPMSWCVDCANNGLEFCDRQINTPCTQCTQHNNKPETVNPRVCTQAHPRAWPHPTKWQARQMERRMMRNLDGTGRVIGNVGKVIVDTRPPPAPQPQQPLRIQQPLRAQQTGNRRPALTRPLPSAHRPLPGSPYLPPATAPGYAGAPRYGYGHAPPPPPAQQQHRYGYGPPPHLHPDWAHFQPDWARQQYGHVQQPAATPQYPPSPPPLLPASPPPTAAEMLIRQQVEIAKLKEEAAEWKRQANARNVSEEVMQLDADTLPVKSAKVKREREPEDDSTCHPASKYRRPNGVESRAASPKIKMEPGLEEQSDSRGHDDRR